MNKKSIVIDGVTYYKEHPDVEKANIAIRRFEGLAWDIRDHLGTAEALYEDFKEQGLTFNAIEAEGFLRSAKTIMARLEAAEKYCE